MSTHDVVVRHLRIRPGEAGRAKKSGWEVDGLGMIAAADVIIDHCSCTWATDENLSASGERFHGATPQEWRQGTSHRITFSNNLIAEGLSNSTHGKGEHSKGSLLHDNTSDLFVVGNLYASNKQRNPLAKGGVSAAIVNNWIFNPGSAAIHHSLVPKEWEGHLPQTSRLSVVGNVLQYGPDTRAGLAFFQNAGNSPLELFLQDNLATDRAGAAVLETSGVLPAALSPMKSVWPQGFTARAAKEVREYIAKNVGARPWERDAIDARIVQGALAGEGKIINSEAEGGGYPQAVETKAKFREEEWDLTTMERRP